jgi:hypothetical protein
MNKTYSNSKNLPFQLIIFAVISLVVCLTRFSHELTPLSLPDASLIGFVAGGLLLKKIRYLFCLFVAVFLIDFYAITIHQYVEVTISISYFTHMLTYLIAWLIVKKWLSDRQLEIKRFFKISAAIIVVTYFISYGSYYLLNTTATDTTFYKFMAMDLKDFLITNFAYAIILLASIKIIDVMENQKTPKNSLLNN